MGDITNLPASGQFSGAQLRALSRSLVSEHNRTSREKPIEYFGATAVAFGVTPVDNRTAFLAAVDWCADTGGRVIIGGGVYGVDGSIPLRSYANFWGEGKHNSQVKQLTPGTDVFTSTAVTGAGVYGCEFHDFTIHGGWTVSWTTDIALATGAGIRLTGKTSGPDEATALAREGVSSLTDPYHTIEGMNIINVLGDGIYMGGRGEMHVKFNKISKCKRYGINNNAPDNWIMGNTVNTTGNSAHFISAGNNRVIGEKYWFNGMHKATEVVGAGFEMSGAGIANVICQGLTTQDTWGPGIVTDGDSPLFFASIDNAGGGRLEQQGFGYTGTRTFNRSFIRKLNTVKSRMIVGIDGGERTTSAPYAVDINGSGINWNDIELYSEGATHLGVRVATGNVTAKRYNRVTENGKMLLGRLTSSQIGDLAHAINHGFGPDIVPIDPSGLAIRDTSGAWNVVSGSTVTPA